MLKSSGVIPDVLDEFKASAHIKVTYAKEIKEGAELAPKDASHAPTVSFDGDENSLYTLAMVDPDAPSRAKHTYREWRHWLVVNMPGGAVKEGKTLSKYMGPSPPARTGDHRYVFAVYKQEDEIDDEPLDDDERGKWNLRGWAKEHGLGAPIAATFFLAKNPTQ